MSYCRNCGTKLSIGSRFCTSCGTKVTDAQLEELTGEKAVVPDTIFQIKPKAEEVQEEKSVMPADEMPEGALEEIDEIEQPEKVDAHVEETEEIQEDSVEPEVSESLENYPEAVEETEVDEEEPEEDESEETAEEIYEDDEEDDSEESEEESFEYEDEEDDDDDEEDERPKSNQRRVLEVQAREYRKKRNNIKKVVIAIIIVIVLVGIGTSIWYFNHNSTSLAADKTEDASTESTAQTEAEAASTVAPSTEEASEASESADASSLGIKASATADYGEVLEPDTYLKYTESNSIPQFAFSYPTNLYNNAEVITTDTTNDYGTNLRTVVFTGENDSSLIVSATARTDGLSLDAAHKYVAETEGARLHDEEVILSSTKASNAKYIASGYLDEDHKVMEYDLVKVTEHYVYHLQIQYPSGDGDEDTKKKGYYVECIYRLCSFTDSSKSCRSYDDYVAGRN